jgi:hypothetical protein
MSGCRTLSRIRRHAHERGDGTWCADPRQAIGAAREAAGLQKCVVSQRLGARPFTSLHSARFFFTRLDFSFAGPAKQSLDIIIRKIRIEPATPQAHAGFVLAAAGLPLHPPQLEVRRLATFHHARPSIVIATSHHP